VAPHYIIYLDEQQLLQNQTDFNFWGTAHR
jgi:hypothetical protein